MFVATMLLQLHLPASQSLKDKRQVVKSVTARLTNQFGVAAAEVGVLDDRQTAEIGVAIVSNQARHAEQVLDAALRYVEETRPDLEIRCIDRDLASFFQ